MDTGNHTAHQKGGCKSSNIFLLPLERKSKKKITNGKMPNQPLPLNDFRVMIREIPETQEWKRRDLVKPRQRSLSISLTYTDPNEVESDSWGDISISCCGAANTNKWSKNGRCCLISHKSPICLGQNQRLPKHFSNTNFRKMNNKAPLLYTQSAAANGRNNS